jgi:nucleoside-diphosphate-sugar epimerase
MNRTDKVLVIGASGQLGSELTGELRGIYGNANVFASDIKVPAGELAESGPFLKLDALDAAGLAEIISKNNINQIYHLAALLSATGENNPQFAWKLNMESLLNVLELAKEKKLKVYWPSSIAAFGPTTPKSETPQDTIMDPSTVYGISKLAGERWCEYYFLKYGVDVRSLRYPGLIGWKTPPGGGTTDYAVDIYHKAIEKGSYECFLSENTMLPMMYMPDALKATLDIMHAESDRVKIRSSYNVAAISFSPKEIAAEISRQIPGFSISYKPDFRQKIADSWPKSINDSEARQHWGWKHEFGLKEMSEDMLSNLKRIK